MSANPDQCLDEIQARLDAATPGPWELRECSPCTERGRLEVNVWDEPGNLLITNWCDDDEFHRPDAEFIAAAPADVRYLLAELRKAREALARTREIHGPMAIYELDENGYVNSDDESKYVRSICGTCSDSSVTESLDDGNYDISGEWGEVTWPCPTAAAVAAAKGDERG